MGTSFATALSAGTGTAVDTYGWDTAFAIPVPDVNKAIVDKKSSPATWSYSETGYSVSGGFGDWQICQGGDGKAVRLSLPLSNVQLTYTQTGKVLNFTDGTAIVEVELYLIPHTADPPPDGGGNPKALVVNPTQTSTSTPAFSVISLTLNPTPGTVSSALVQQGLQDWGNANLAEFNHVFAVVVLNRMVDQGQWGFVTPNDTSYAYLDGSTLDDSVFAVLCMTGTRTAEDLSEQVSPSAIPSGSVAGFLISQERTLFDLVRPAVKLAYPGLTDDNFLMSSDATMLYLTDNTSVDLPPVNHNGSTYYPKLTQLQITSNGQILTLQSYTTTDVGDGVTATCQSTHWYEVTLGSSSSGQTLQFAEAQPPDIVHDAHQSEGGMIAQIILDIIAAIALIILTILTDGAALVVGGLVIGLILGATNITPPAIEKANHDDSPDISLLLVNSVDPIQWPGSSAFQLNYASLNGSLQLGGDPKFV